MSNFTLDSVTRASLLAEWKSSPDSLAPAFNYLTSRAMQPYNFRRQIDRFDGSSAAILIQQAEEESIRIVVGSGYLIKKGYMLLCVSITLLLLGVVYSMIFFFLGFIPFYMAMEAGGGGHRARIQPDYDRRFITDIRRFADLILSRPG